MEYGNPFSEVHNFVVFPKKKEKYFLIRNRFCFLSDFFNFPNAPNVNFLKFFEMTNHDCLKHLFLEISKIDFFEGIFFF